MKMLHHIKSSVLLVASAVSLIHVNAQTGPTAVVTTGAPSLRIAADARSGGMGNVGIATSSDAGTLFFNQAKAPFAKSTSSVAVNYTPWMREVAKDMYALHLSGYHRFDSLQAFTGSVRYFNLGDFKLKDINGNLLQTARPHEFSIDLGYARKLSEHLSIGVALRYINSSLASGGYGSAQYKPGEGIAGDVSLFYTGQDEKEKGFSAGLSLTNIGSKISYTENATQKEFLPANLGLGLAYTAIINDDNKLTFAVDVNKLLVPGVPQTVAEREAYYKQGALSGLGKGFSNKAWQYGVGAEYAYKQIFTLRAGYLSESENQGNRKGLTAGAGIRYDVFAFNFSYLSATGSESTRNPLSNTLRFGIQLGF